MRSLLAALADLVLPTTCVGCGRAGAALCRVCLPAGAPRLVAAEPPLVAAASYEGAVRAALLAYKERGRRDLTEPLAALLTRCVAKRPAALLVPVPSSSRLARSRGGDHVLRLAQAAARQTGARVVTPVRLTRPTQDSAGLDARARANNLRGAMRADPAPSRAPVVVVDDIVTTGATLRESARALSVSGWSVHGFAVVAATPRRASVAPLARPRGPVYRGADLTE